MFTLSFAFLFFFFKKILVNRDQHVKNIFMNYQWQIIKHSSTIASVMAQFTKLNSGVKEIAKIASDRENNNTGLKQEQTT